MQAGIAACFSGQRNSSTLFGEPNNSVDRAGCRCRALGIEAPIMAAPKPKETIMIIGTFTYNRTKDTYIGKLATLTGEIALRFTPVEPKTEKSPSYRVFAEARGESIECGAAWQRTSKSDQEFLNVRLDDPTWPKPISCALLPGDDDSFILIWQREAAKAERRAA